MKKEIRAELMKFRDRVTSMKEFFDDKPVDDALSAILKVIREELPDRFDHLDKILQLYKGITSYTRDYQIGFMEGHNVLLAQLKSKIGGE